METVFPAELDILSLQPLLELLATEQGDPGSPSNARWTICRETCEVHCQMHRTRVLYSLFLLPHTPSISAPCPQPVLNMWALVPLLEVQISPEDMHNLVPS